MKRKLTGVPEPEVTSWSPEEAAWMQQAMEHAEQARGTTGDNPWVGCVIVRAGEPLAWGHTHPPGEDHAEAAAIRQAQETGQTLEGATLYCTLEPCAFVGRTPACAETIASSGVTRVVIGIRDPHPRVNGAGVAILQQAGVTVAEGLLAEPIRQQLHPWLEQFPDSTDPETPESPEVPESQL